MLDSNAPVADLTDQQRAVVEASIDSCQLVLGGAGTGKTHVLIERIAHLIETEEVAPGSEVLVLSFTRAVVRELKRRLRSSEGDARLVRPATFDSFATRLLRELPEDEPPPTWREAGYDGRIAAAVAAISGGGEAATLIGEYRHVLVDEIQDLVSVRADLVLEILRHASGFTLLGDPAQAIYGYQLKDDPTATTSEQFLAEVLAEYPDLSITTLEEDFRSRHTHSDVVTQIGAVLRDPRTDDADALPLLTQALGVLDHVHSFDDLAFALTGVHERTAVLCRTNAECLRVSKILFEAGVRHHLQQEATERVLPPWLAELFRGTDRRRWGEPRLRELVEERRAVDTCLPETETVLGYLTDAVRDETVDLDVLRERIRWGQAPEPPLSGELPLVVVSTIHRAKGLEFDRVFFGAPRDGVPAGSAEELRVLYVALSRCKEDVWTFKAPNTKLWWKPENRDDRWVKSPFHERWKTLGWELRPEDVDGLRPPGAAIAEVAVGQLQDRLASEDLVGSRVELRLAHVRESDEPIPFYALVVEEETVGVTSETFGEALSRRLRRRGRAKFPLAMSRVFVVGVETVIGPPSEGEANGLGVSGLWLRPRVAGLAHVDWYAQ